MAEGAEIRARINSITETKKITDAMEEISYVKMNRARRAVESAAPYFQALKEEIGALVRHMPKTKNRYFRAVGDKAGKVKRAVLLVTADKGLAGDYNHAAIALCRSFLQENPEALVFIVGEYGRQFFSARKMPFVSDFRYSAELPTVWKARRICADLLEYFDRGSVNEIRLICADFQNGRKGKCRQSVLLPLDKSLFAEKKETSRTEDPEPAKCYPDAETVLTGVIPGYLTGFLYASLVDSFCSEQQARMMAMNAAGRNAEEMLRTLKLRYNRVRQAAITREITEVTAGSAALRRGRAFKDHGGKA